VTRKIEDTLKRSAEIEAKRVSIDVRTGGTVKREGKVRDSEERMAVRKVAAFSAWGASRRGLPDNRVISATQATPNSRPRWFPSIDPDQC
jgi:hypothetical protein